jgi:hypothetical protein
VRLSVLIPTLARRQHKFLHLLSELLPQCQAAAEQVEVVALQNQGEELLEAYRERLLYAAEGDYLCFVDDDDKVASYYVADILEALRSDPDVVGWRHINHGTPGFYTDVSIALQPGNRDSGYQRRFTHMNPVRSSLAKQGTFLRGGYGYTGEDMVYVNSVLPLLKHEVLLRRPVYDYQWSAWDTTQNGPQPKPAQPHERPEIPVPCFRWCE